MAPCAFAITPPFSSPLPTLLSLLDFPMSSYFCVLFYVTNPPTDSPYYSCHSSQMPAFPMAPHYLLQNNAPSLPTWNPLAFLQRTFPNALFKRDPSYLPSVFLFLVCYTQHVTLHARLCFSDNLISLPFYTHTTTPTPIWCVVVGRGALLVVILWLLW